MERTEIANAENLDEKSNMPEWKPEIRRRLAKLRLEPTRETEIVEELSQHLEDHYTGSLAGGAIPEEAYRAALAELSEGATLQRELRRVERQVAPEPIALGTIERINMVTDFLQDLRYTARTLWKQPGFTTMVTLTIALSIGVNITFFSLFSLAFRPLPAKGSGVVLDLKREGARGMLGYSMSEYEYFRDHTQVFSDIIASDETILKLGRGAAAEESESVRGEFVSDKFFSVLGARTVLGRAFAPEENRAPGQNPVVVLSHPFWQGRLGGDPNIVGKTVWLNGNALVVVGVTAPDFVGLGLRKLRVTDVWLPLMMRSEASLQAQVLSSKRGGLTISGLLKPGRTPAEARAEIQFLSGQLARDGSGINPNARVVAQPLFVIPSGSKDWPILTVVFTATAMVLLIACSNIANLMLARAARRRQEIGVRICLGASRRVARLRLIRWSHCDTSERPGIKP